MPWQPFSLLPFMGWIHRGGHRRAPTPHRLSFPAAPGHGRSRTFIIPESISTAPFTPVSLGFFLMNQACLFSITGVGAPVVHPVVSLLGGLLLAPPRWTACLPPTPSSLTCLCFGMRLVRWVRHMWRTLGASFHAKLPQKYGPKTAGCPATHHGDGPRAPSVVGCAETQGSSFNVPVKHCQPET